MELIRIQVFHWHLGQKIWNQFCQDLSNSFYLATLSLTEIPVWVPSMNDRLWVIIYDLLFIVFEMTDNPIKGRVMGVLQRLGISNLVGTLTFMSHRLNECTQSIIKDHLVFRSSWGHVTFWKSLFGSGLSDPSIPSIFLPEDHPIWSLRAVRFWISGPSTFIH